MGSWKRPNPRLLISEGALRPPGGGCDAHRCLRNHHFVRRVEVFYPDAADGSNAADGNEAGPKGAFTIAEVGISGILEHGFAEKYVRIGGLYMMAADQMVERHNTACVAAGVLHMSIDQDTYTVLGLCGEKSPFPCQPGFRRITVDLMKESFRSGNPEFERVRQCLNKLNPSRFVAACDPREGSSPEAVEFPADHAFAQKRCSSSSHPPTKLANLRVPVPPHGGWKGTGNDGEELWEWLSLLHGGVIRPLTWSDSARAADVYPSSFRSPQLLDHAKGGGTKVVTTGFVTPSITAQALEAARAAVESGKAPWASLCMWGYEAAPLSWGGARRADSREGGGHDVVVLVQPGGGACLLFEAVGGYDEHGRVLCSRQ